MKKTKVLLSLLLSFLMIFSSVATLAEEATTTSLAFTDVEAGTKVSDAITTLVAHGIMNGYPDGTFKPDGSITRAEVAAVIVRFKKLANGLPADAVTGFSDLDNDTSAAWARPYVKAAVDAGIINGFEDGTYRASEPVTYEQVIKMIICAIGYDVIAASEKSRLEAIGQPTTWSSGYIAAANKYYITANALNTNVTMPASRGTVAVITSNALDAPVLNLVTDDNGNMSYEMGDTSVGEEGRDKLEKIEGYVSGNYYTSLTSQTPGLTPTEILITSNGKEEKYKLSSTVQARTDTEDIIGKRVIAYYSDLDGEITSLEVSKSNTKAVKEQEIKSISGNTLKYGKETVSLDDYTFIYNGKYLPTDEAIDLLNTEFTNGQIEFVSDGVKVAKVTSYRVGVVKSYTSSNKNIYFRYDVTNTPYEYKPKEFDLVMVNGSETKPENVTFSSYNVINILESPAGAEGNALKKMYVTKENVSGKVTETTESNRVVVINDKAYYLTQDYHNFEGTPSEAKAPFVINSSYNCYLDYTGQIAAVNYTVGSGDGYKYGFFLYADDASRELGYDYEVSILTSSGTISSYFVKGKITIDGVQSDADDIADTGIIPEYTPIRYKSKSSSDGTELTSIDLPGTGDRTDDDYLKMDYASSDGAFTVTSAGSALKRGTTSFKVDSKSVILFVPDDKEDTSAYSKLNRDTVFKASKSFDVDVLDIQDSFANFVVVYGSDDPTIVFDDSATFMLVTNKHNLSGGGIEFTGYVNYGSETSVVKALEDDGYKAISGAASSADQADEGDVIRYITNDSGEIISLMIWYDASDPVQEGVAENINQAKNTYERYQKTEGGGTVKLFSYGTVVSKGRSDENIVLGYYIDTDSDEIEDKFGEIDGQIQLIKVDTSTKFYGEADGELVLLDMDSIKVSEGTTAGSRVVVVWIDTKNPTAKMVYILD